MLIMANDEVLDQGELVGRSRGLPPIGELRFDLADGRILVLTTDEAFRIVDAVGVASGSLSVPRWR